MSSEEEEFEKNKRDRARKLELETREKQRRTDKMREQKYRDKMRDRFGRMMKPTPQSRQALPGAEIGTEDDGVKAVEMQQLIDKYKKKDDTYSGKVIKSIKPVGEQSV